MLGKSKLFSPLPSAPSIIFHTYNKIQVSQVAFFIWICKNTKVPWTTKVNCGSLHNVLCGIDNGSEVLFTFRRSIVKKFEKPVHHGNQATF